MTTHTKPITAEELFEMGDIGRCELVRGEIIHMSPSGAEHGDVAAESLRLIANHVKSETLSKVYAAETGFTIARDPDTTRAPDVAFRAQGTRAENLSPRVLRRPAGFGGRSDFPERHTLRGEGEGERMARRRNALGLGRRSAEQEH